ncbi:MAG: hypothetical protein K0M50_03310 [Prolixibacteraceae bacterium]|nr:hypothetical protein [Prolixibacteraceae bacterium]
MIKCRLYPKNYSGVGIDDDYFVSVNLPALPFIGTFIRVDWTDLENRLKTNLNKVSLFSDNWFYYESKGKQSHEITVEDLKNFSLDDAGYVHQITMIANQDYVLIEIGDAN